MTYQTLLQSAVDEMEEVGIDDPSLDAWLLLEAASGLTFTAFHLVGGDEAPEDVIEKFTALKNRRIAREPIQLILGNTEFMGLVFEMDGNELIPRQDTETLVEEVLSYAKEAADGLTLLDLFTGSGCIATALAVHGDFQKIYAGDISDKALKNAKANAAAHNADVTFRIGDMFEPFEGESFDVITANPPYIKAADIEQLQPEVRDYDPRLALDGGEDGLVFYRRLAAQAQEHLSDDGAIFMEIGADQGAAVCTIFQLAGYEDIRLIKDLCKNDRVVFARK